MLIPLGMLDYAERLSPYYELLAPPPDDQPEYVQRQWERWRWDAERYLLTSTPEDVAATLRPHLLRRLRSMMWVIAHRRDR